MLMRQTTKANQREELGVNRSYFYFIRVMQHQWSYLEAKSFFMRALTEMKPCAAQPSSLKRRIYSRRNRLFIARRVSYSSFAFALLVIRFVPVFRVPSGCLPSCLVLICVYNAGQDRYLFPHPHWKSLPSSSFLDLREVTFSNSLFATTPAFSSIDYIISSQQSTSKDKKVIILTKQQIISSKPIFNGFSVSELLQPSLQMLLDQLEGIVTKNIKFCKSTKQFAKRKKFLQKVLLRGDCERTEQEKVETQQFFNLCRYFQAHQTLEGYAYIQLQIIFDRVYYPEKKANLRAISIVNEAPKRERTKKSSKSKKKGDTKSNISQTTKVEEIFSAAPSVSTAATVSSNIKQCLPYINSNVSSQQIEKKKKQMQQLKLKYEILQQKSKMLEIQAEIYHLENQISTIASKKQLKHPSIIQNQQSQPQHSILQPNLTKNPHQNEAVIYESDPLPQLQAQKTLDQKQDIQEQYKPAQEDEDYVVDIKKRRRRKSRSKYRIEEATPKQVKIINKKQVLPILKKDAATSPQKSNITQPKRKKQSITPNNRSKKKITQNKQAQNGKEKKSTHKHAKTQKIQLKLPSSTSESKKTTENLVKIQNSKPNDHSSPPSLANKSKKKCTVSLASPDDYFQTKWSQQQQKQFIKQLPKLTYSTISKLQKSLSESFGKKIKFGPQNLNEKYIDMFKISKRRFLSQLNSRQMLEDKQFKQFTLKLQNLDHKLEFQLISDFIVRFFLRDLDRLPNKVFKETIKQVQSITTNLKKQNSPPSRDILEVEEVPNSDSFDLFPKKQLEQPSIQHSQPRPSRKRQMHHLDLTNQDIQKMRRHRIHSRSQPSSNPQYTASSKIQYQLGNSIKSNEYKLKQQQNSSISNQQASCIQQIFKQYISNNQQEQKTLCKN